MAKKNYSMEFRQQAVDLFQSTPGATLLGIASDLGISHGALRSWVSRYGSQDPRAGVSSDDGSREGKKARGSQAARIAELEAENAALRAEQSKLATERDILRAAAKYFAKETNW